MEVRNSSYVSVSLM